MENKISQKAFDSHLHIIRDPRFDVDKYKVGELYVINNALKILDNNNELNDIDKTLKDFVDCEPILFQKNKVIGELIKVDEHSLTFKVLVNHPDPRYVAVYSYVHFTLSIDKILEYHIEIERLFTETEAAVYLASVFVKGSANDLFKSQIDWQKEMRHGAEYYCTPEKYQDDTSKECAKDTKAKQSTLDPKDPKFNRMLGLVPDMNQFPYTLENTNSYQELDAAYKKEFDIKAESQEDSNIDRNNYTIQFNDEISRYNNYTRPVSFINEKGNFATYLFKSLQSSKSGYINIDMVKGKNKISLKIKPKDITIEPDFIGINIQKSSYIATSIKLRIEDFHEMFDIIRFDQNSNISKISKG